MGRRAFAAREPAAGQLRCGAWTVARRSGVAGTPGIRGRGDGRSPDSRSGFLDHARPVLAYAAVGPATPPASPGGRRRALGRRAVAALPRLPDRPHERRADRGARRGASALSGRARVDRPARGRPGNPRAAPASSWGRRGRPTGSATPGRCHAAVLRALPRADRGQPAAARGTPGGLRATTRIPRRRADRRRRGSRGTLAAALGTTPARRHELAGSGARRGGRGVRGRRPPELGRRAGIGRPGRRRGRYGGAGAGGHPAPRRPARIRASPGPGGRVRRVFPTGSAPPHTAAPAGCSRNPARPSSRCAVTC